MIIKKFKELFESCAKEVSMNGEVVDSHSGIPAKVIIDCINSDKYYDIENISISHLGGCGCPSSVVIEISEEIEETPECYDYEETTKDMARYESKPFLETKFPAISSITVPTEYDKEQLLKASRYIHNLKEIDADFIMINLLSHLYLSPQLIKVEK